MIITCIRASSAGLNWGHRVLGWHVNHKGMRRLHLQNFHWDFICLNKCWIRAQTHHWVFFLFNKRILCRNGTSQGITDGSRLISRGKKQQIHRELSSELKSTWACGKPFEFSGDDRTHSLLIISLFNLDLWALVFQSTWSIRIEVSFKCIGGGTSPCLTGGLSIYAFLQSQCFSLLGIFTLRHATQSKTN